MDKALADFAELYADQNELDYAALDAAVKTGRVKSDRAQGSHADSGISKRGSP